MFRAISFGVFWRLAPSTRAIIRSRKVSPGFAVIFTTIRSDSTLVPPVTADRSPPDSRMTGADSPVMADSSTLAMPSTISPSEGMTSPGPQTTRSPRPRSELATSSTPPSARFRRATVSVRALRSVSAWALPRPSATASAKLAKSTVNHSHAATRPANRFWVPDRGAQVSDEQERGEHAAELHHEHHRVADHGSWRQLDEAVAHRPSHNRRVHHGLLCSGGHCAPNEK